MKLIVWNSQGGKWDIFWDSYINPEMVANPIEDIVGLLVESGWAPWVTPGDVIINNCYGLDNGLTYYDTTAPASHLC